MLHLLRSYYCAVLAVTVVLIAVEILVHELFDAWLHNDVKQHYLAFPYPLRSLQKAFSMRNLGHENRF